MKISPLSTSITLCALTLLSMESPLLSAELYYDNFIDTPYGNDARWVNYRDTGTNVLSPGPFAGPYFSNWLASGNGFTEGYIFIQHQNGAQASDYLLHSNPANSLGIAPETLDYQSLYAKWQENSEVGVTRHAAVLIGNQWYVSDSSAPQVSGTNRAIDLTKGSWQLLNVTTGTGGSLAIDDTQTYQLHNLLGGGASINSFGFYVDMPAFPGSNLTARFDRVALSTGLHWGGDSGVGDSGTWNSTASNTTWKAGAAGAMPPSGWTNQDVAIFGHHDATGGPAVITVGSNVTARSLEFYQNADGYQLLGNVAPGADMVPGRSIQISSDTPFRSLYLAPNINVTVGGSATTGIRIHQSASPLHIYGGGKLTIGQNGMVRTEQKSDLILNDDTTVEVLASGQFNASRDLYVGSGIDTLDGSSGNAHLILNGGTSVTRTGDVGGDLILGGPTGTGNLTVKNGGSFTTSQHTQNGVVFAGAGVIHLESDGVLATRRISKLASSPGEATLRFNGGTLRVNAATGSAASFIGTDLQRILVSDGGATIHTNGHDTTIATALSHDSAGSAVDGGLTKTGQGILTMDVTNQHTGATKVLGGTLKSNTFGVLGSSSNDASNFVLDGGTFWLTASGVNTNRALTIGAGGGTLKASGFYRINGAIVAAAGSTLNIEGDAWLSGDSKNTFHGDINVVSGEFLVRRASSLGSATGNLTVRSGATFSIDHNGTGGGGHMPADNVYADAMILEENATFGTRGRNGAPGAGLNANTVYTGNITLNGPGTSTIRVANANNETNDIPDLTVTGEIMGLGGLRKTGAGKMILTRANTYTGKTQVEAGIIALSGAASIQSSWIEVHTPASFDVSATASTYTLSSQTLSGSGSIEGSLIFGAGTYLKPGLASANSDSTKAGDLVGTLTFTQSLTLGAQASAVFQIAGTSLHDKLLVQGAFNALNQSTIEVQWNQFEASLGDSFDLIDFASATWGSDYQDQLFSRLMLPTFSNTGLAWDTSDFLSHGILRVAAIPEPSRMGLSVLALSLLWGTRRRSSLL